MRDNEELAQEVQHRIRVLRSKNARRKNRIYAAIATTSCLILIVGLSAVLPSIVPSQTSEPLGLYHATLLADSGIGAYVLVGGVSFVLGVIVTLLCVKLLSKKE